MINATFDNISTWLHQYQQAIKEGIYSSPEKLIEGIYSDADKILQNKLDLAFVALKYERQELFISEEPKPSPNLQAKVAELEARVRWLETHHGGGLPANKPEGTPCEEPYGPYCWHW